MRSAEAMSAIGDQIIPAARCRSSRCRRRRRGPARSGWVRANLFSSPANIALTLLCVALIAWAVPPLVRFFLIDAIWTGTDRRGLRRFARAAQSGRLLGVRAGLVFLFRLWLLSARRALACRCVLRRAGVRLRAGCCGCERRAAISARSISSSRCRSSRTCCCTARR